MQINVGLGIEQDESHEGQEYLEDIINILENKRVLIILDSIEGFLADKGPNFRATVEELLNRCRYVKILTTSRQRLHNIGEFQEQLVVVDMLSNLDSVKLFFDQAKGKNAAFDKKNAFNEQLLSLIKLDKKVRKRFEKRNKAIHLIPLNELYELLSEHTLFQRFEGHPQAIRLVASMTMDHTLAELYQVVTSKGFGLGQKCESHPFHSLVGAQEASIKHLNLKDPKAVKLFILVGMMPAGVIDIDLEHLWGHNWQSLARLLVGRDLIRKKELPFNVDIGQKTNFKYMLLPFMNISSFLPNYQQDEDELHKKIYKYYLKMVMDLFDKLDVEQVKNKCNRGQMQVHRNKLRFYEESIVESFARTLAYRERNRYKRGGGAPPAGTQRRMSHMQSKSSEQDTFQGSLLEKDSEDVAKNGENTCQRVGAKISTIYDKQLTQMNVLVQKSDEILRKEIQPGMQRNIAEK